MTDQEREKHLQYVRAFREKIKGNTELCRKYLVEIGIYTEDGQLTEPYKNLYIPRPDEKSVI
jgi:hypothetical protein